MIQVWKFDQTKIFTESTFVYEQLQEGVEGECFDETKMTRVPLLVGYVKAKFNGTNWEEGAAPQEIVEWEEANKPLPVEPDKTEVLRQELDQTNLYVTELELQNLQQQNEINATNQFATELELKILELQMGGAV